MTPHERELMLAIAWAMEHMLDEIAALRNNRNHVGASNRLRWAREEVERKEDRDTEDAS